ncbi:ABC transporter [Paenibacillus sp. YN15]|uniref:ABC transporter n=1 Tax=Paenibacillus sp. YN15 TaxID=1742774 RepID=UPI000DCCC65C|nr:ABC transporter [Paenibacillus sp. YN15]RAV03480.1 ABC transporter [Paenibacillus sp. YN15]
MRFFSAFANDVRYQVKYGFYFLYAFITAIYIAILFVVPGEYKKTVASIIILTDPVMLGTFFIGGIWLLEKGEGLHDYWGISPLRPVEYILSKAVSLSVISTLASCLLVLIGLKEQADFFTLSISVFVGSMVFTSFGLFVASYARSVNHYMILVTPLEIFVSLPPILAVFGLSLPIFDVLPGVALWRIIGHSIGMNGGETIWLYIILILWLGVALLLTTKRIPVAMQTEGGERS